MLSLPSIVMMPLFSGAVAAALEWPALGAVLAWLLVLSLLSASAGLVRERRGAPSEPPQDRRSEPREPEMVPHVHREAA